MAGADVSFPTTLGLKFAAAPPGSALRTDQRDGRGSFTLVGTFVPRPEHRGPPGVLHGGLAATCLDETMAALGWALDRVHTLTATLELKYRHPIPLDGRQVRCEAWRDRPEPRRVQRVRGRVVLADGTVAVEAVGLFVQARKGGQGT